jgi:hypothetical protein
MKIGRLTVVEVVRVERGRKVYRFECDCGSGQHIVRRIDLVRSSAARGSVPSCSLCGGGQPRKSPYCIRCEGMPHRRPPRGVCDCGGHHEAEELPPIWVLAQHRRTA